MEKYQITFIDWDDEEIPYTEKYFDSKTEAENWVEENERTFEDMDGEGGWITRYFYYNPQTEIDYPNYTVNLTNQNLSEEIYRLQKLAGIITEREYIELNSKIWCDDYIKTIDNAINYVKGILKKHE
jgi:hypothetical protein